MINKVDLAPHVGASLEVMESDTKRMRQTDQGIKPYVLSNLRTLQGLEHIIEFIEMKGMLK